MAEKQSSILDDHPALQLSSDSEDDNGDEVSLNASDGHLGRRIAPEESDLRRSFPGTRVGSENLDNKHLSSELLSSVAKMHLHMDAGSERFAPNVPLTETRSCFSTPGRSSFALRERLGRLIRTDSSESPSDADEPISQRKSARRSNSINRTGSIPRINRMLPTTSNGGRSFDGSLSVGSEATEPKVSIKVEQTSEQDSLMRLKRQANYGSTRIISMGPVHTNTVKLHIYDLISKDTLMQLPFGCMCEIGKCFNEMNSALHQLGTGAYHVGVEINGIEYAFGATSAPGRTGIFSCMPKLSPGYQFRTTIDLGSRTVLRRSWMRVPRATGRGEDYKEVERYIDGRQVIKEMVPEYMGIDYDLLRKNCCTFAHDVCLRMNVSEDEIPSWFRNLAESGAKTQDLAYATVQPLQMVMSNCEEAPDETGIDQEIKGFEAIRKTSRNGRQDIVMVVDAKRVASLETTLPTMRRNLSWAY